MRRQKVEQKAFEKKAKEALNAPAGDLSRIWKMMEESAAETCQIKLYKEEGDQKPFRAIIFVQGKTAVKQILEMVDSFEKDEE
jgi:hypothetical protein